MIRLIAITFLLSFPFVQNAQAQLFDNLKKQAGKLLQNPGSFTQEEAARALREALSNGITKGTAQVSKQDGFFLNPEIKIPFPEDARKVESSLRKIGMNKQVDDAILSLNRAAEDASKGALDIFLGAITAMTISDAIAIVKGDQNAGTEFLRKNTTAQLTEKFRPVIQGSLDKVQATRYWADIMGTYNKIPFVQKINPDLNAYVTQKALEGLFLMIAREEVQIRRDPAARTTDILKKVFGN